MQQVTLGWAALSVLLSLVLFYVWPALGYQLHCSSRALPDDCRTFRLNAPLDLWYCDICKSLLIAFKDY